MTRVPLRPAMLLAVAAGGALGAVLRWAATTAVPDADGFPWTTLAINVLGSLALAALPAVAAARRRPLLGAALGPGLLGGFTTLSAYAEQGRALAAHGHPVQSLAYLLTTVAACLVAVHVGRRATRAAVER